MMLIELDLTISQILEMYPETREVFITNGFPQFADKEIQRDLGTVLKLKTALKSKNLNVDAFIKLLEGKIHEVRQYSKLSSSVVTKGKCLDLLALLPCPLKVPLQGELQLVLNQMRLEKSLDLHYTIDTSANKYIHYEEYIPYFEDPDEVPDIILTTGYEFLHEKFVERFVKNGIFLQATGQQVNSRFTSAQLLDPQGHFFVLAVNALVMVVEKKRLGSLPVPRTWSDLLNPVFENQVVMRGHGDIFCDALQLYYYKDYGNDGITGLARAVRYGLHPAQMVKELNGSRNGLPPIYIMPRFFAETLNGHKNIEIIWPSDGALVYPVSLLVKASKAVELKKLVDYLTGAQAARVFDEAFFPSSHLQGGRSLAESASFKWVGWDYIRSCGIERLQQELNDRFLDAWRGGSSACS